MDRIKVERAIDGLTEWQKHVQTNSDIDRDISTAIEALKAQHSQEGTTSDLISRQAAIDALAEQMPTPYTPDGSHPADEQIFQVQEVYADCITTIELLPTIQSVATDTNVGNNSEIPNSSDAISRQWLLDCINDGWIKFDTEKDENRFIHLVRDIAPSAQLEPKKGHWIPHETPDGGEQYECSRCGVLWEFNDGTPEDNEAYFCPKCGAKMKGAERETD